MNRDLIEISKNVLTNIDNIDNIVDSYFEPIKDYTDTVSDIFTPIKVVHTLYTFNKKRKFKSFLKYYAVSIDNGGINISDNSIKMYNYLGNSKNFNFIQETIESSIDSKSIYGSMILGYFAGKILTDVTTITFKELIILEALKELNDFELSCFTKIYSIVDLTDVINIHKYKEDLLNPFLFELTISKLIQLRIVEEAPILVSGKPKGSFISTDIAEEIYFMIKEMNLEVDLLNYEF